MDEAVLRAVARWPNVPAVAGWLRLDRRGRWLVRNAATDAFEPITNPQITAFIGRNYERDDRGRWFFQNGPQRVFVELDYTPWIVRLSADGAVPTFTTTTAAAFTPTGCFADEGGNVLLSGRVAGHDAEDTIALLHDHDLEPFSSLAQWHGDACGAALGTLSINHATFDIEPIHSADVARRYGFVQHPAG